MKENLIVIGKKNPLQKIVLSILVLLCLFFQVYAFILSFKYELDFSLQYDFTFYMKKIVSPIFWILIFLALLVLIILTPSKLITYNKSTKILKIRIGRWFKKIEFYLHEVDYVDYAHGSLNINIFYAKHSGGYITIVLKNGETFVVSDILKGKLVKEKLDKLINNEVDTTF